MRGAGGLEEDGGVGGGLPARGSDFDELGSGVGEVEEDLVGETIGAAAADAAVDGEVLAGFVGAGCGFEVIEDGMELAGGGQGFELGVGCLEEPVAEVAGADGVDVAASVVVEADECLAVGGGEGVAAGDEADEFVG